MGHSGRPTTLPVGLAGRLGNRVPHGKLTSPACTDFDGISSLPAELRPPRALYLKWAARTAQIEQANKRLNQLLPELNTLYREAGLHPVLLKGQGIGTNYRTPLHRQCGDIDIYLGKQGQPIANRLLLQQGAIVEEKRPTSMPATV